MLMIYQSIIPYCSIVLQHDHMYSLWFWCPPGFIWRAIGLDAFLVDVRKEKGPLDLIGFRVWSCDRGSL